MDEKYRIEELRNKKLNGLTLQERLHIGVEDDYRLAHEKNTKKSKNCVIVIKDTIANIYKISKVCEVDKIFKTSNTHIELLFVNKYPTEKQASKFETLLHNMFFDKNINGGWFNLNSEDLEKITLMM